jgi:hypothetical protein
MERLAPLELQKQAVWLFGVLTGVAIKEVITRFHAELVSRGELWGGVLLTARLVLFLMVCLRFYFGAVQYFTAVYARSVPTNELQLRFGTDLIFGLFHLGFVCLCGLSVNLLDRLWQSFPASLIAVLMCDVLWYIWSASDTRKAIRVRVLVNTVTAAFAAIAFGATALAFMYFANEARVELTQGQGVICEVATYVPVIWASVAELRRLIQGRAGVEEWLGEALPRAPAG